MTKGIKTAKIGAKDWTVVSEKPIAEVVGNRLHLLQRMQSAGIQSWVLVRRPNGKRTYLAYKWLNGNYGWQG